MSGQPIAVLVMAYGSPRSRDEILPYYTDIRRGRPPTEEQLADLIRRYEAIAPAGGEILSPLAERTEAQAAALQRALDEVAPGTFEVELGRKHSSPRIEDAVDSIASRGRTRIVALVLAPHYSSASIGEYLGRVRAAATPHGIEVAAVESWATEPALIEFLAGAVERRLAEVPAGSAVLFTAHSLPRRVVEAGDPYPQELLATATAVAERTGLGPDAWSTAWQSAGRTPEPWLEPDVLTAIDSLAAAGVPGVVVCGCGFVADHLEVLYDLDIQAAERAAARGIAFARTPSVDADPDVIRALARRVAAA